MAIFLMFAILLAQLNSFFQSILVLSAIIFSPAGVLLALAPRATIGCFCGNSASNPSQAAFFDLEAADPADWLNAGDTALFDAVDATPKLIRAFSTNKSPALLSIPALSAHQMQRAHVIANAPEFLTRVSQAMAARFPEDPPAPPPPRGRSTVGSTAMPTRRCSRSSSTRTGPSARRSLQAFQTRDYVNSADA